MQDVVKKVSEGVLRKELQGKITSLEISCELNRAQKYSIFQNRDVFIRVVKGTR